MRFDLMGNRSFIIKKKRSYFEAKHFVQGIRFFALLPILIAAFCFSASDAFADFSVTGGTVISGSIQVRPAENQSNNSTVTITGTRDENTRVWVKNWRSAHEDDTQTATSGNVP